MRAMEFGLRVRHPGYNIYVSGFTGTGRTTYARHAVKEVAALQDTPDEWCYIYNFNDPSQPLALWLPAGQGLVFARAIEELLRDIRAELPRAFASEEYQEQQDAIARRLQRDSAEILNQTEEAARQQGFALKRTSSGVMTVPIQETANRWGRRNTWLYRWRSAVTWKNAAGNCRIWSPMQCGESGRRKNRPKKRLKN